MKMKAVFWFLNEPQVKVGECFSEVFQKYFCEVFKSIAVPWKSVKL